MKANKLKKLVSAAFAFCVAALCAEQRGLSLVGDGGSTVVWSLSPDNQIWKLVGSETMTAYAEGDNVTIGSDFTGSKVEMQALVNPGDVVFDIPESKTVNWGGSAAKVGFGPQTRSFVKRGRGTLVAEAFMGDVADGNTYAGGVEIEDGEVSLATANGQNSLGLSLLNKGTKPADGYWVNVRSGATLTLNERNQTSTSYTDTDSLFDVFLEQGATLSLYPKQTTAGNNHCNIFRWLRLDAQSTILSTPFGRVRHSNVAQNTTDAYGYSGLRLSQGLHFTGSSVHHFGLSSLGAGADNWRISLNHAKPIEFKVDDITGDAGVDAYVDLGVFTWKNGTTASLTKTGAGTLAFTNAWGKTNSGDITVESGTLIFANAQAFLPSKPTESQYKILVKNGATLDIQKRNLIEGTGGNIPRNSIEVDQGTLYIDMSRPEVENGASGWIRFAKWTFKDAEFHFANHGQNSYYSALAAFDEFNVLGSKPIVVMKSTSSKVGYLDWQTFAVYTNTIFTVEDASGDASADLTIGLDLFRYTMNGKEFVTGCGFTKRGAGMMRLTGVNSNVDGSVKVEEGELRVDGTLTTAASIAVAAGGCLGGTGTVANVTLEAGAAVAVNAEADLSQARPLRVSGDLTLPTSGLVVLPALKADIEVPFRGKPILEVSGTLIAEDLSGWKIVDRTGEEVVSSNALYVRGNRVYAGECYGAVLLIK